MPFAVVTVKRVDAAGPGALTGIACGGVHTPDEQNGKLAVIVDAGRKVWGGLEGRSNGPFTMTGKS